MNTSSNTPKPRWPEAERLRRTSPQAHHLQVAAPLARKVAQAEPEPAGAG